MKRFIHSCLAITAGVLLAMTIGACSNNEEERVPNADDTAGAVSVPGTTPGDTVTNTGTADTMPAGTASGQLTDANIFAKLDASNSEEIDHGKMGSEKAKNGDVKKFAQLLVTDHTKMKNEGADLASRLNITPQPPSGDTSAMKMQRAMDMLNSVDPARFDSLFVAMQVDGHQKTLDDLKMMQGMATNDSLKALIGRAMPVVQGHLDKARELQGKVK